MVVNLEHTDTSMTLGVDIGRVIIDGDGAADTSFFSDNYLRTPPVEGAFESLRRLVDERFGTRVYLVSKCGPRVQDKTVRWLAHREFHARTGIRPEHVHFCRARADKAGICEDLGITHFVDDRLEVLGYMKSVETRYLFRAQPKEVRRQARHLDAVIQVSSWREILDRELG